MPPTKSDRVGLLMTFPNVFPCAVATSWTPRSAMVRAAIASSSVPISSMTTTSGMWFSTASIITRCCSSVFGTCILLARPIAGCGTAPSPAISFDVSTMTTLLDASSASTLATSRRMVVLPTPGLPSMSTLLLLSMRFWMSFTLPNTALPTLQVSPTGSPSRSRITENRCRVRSMPALLSSPNLPSPERTCCISSIDTSWLLNVSVLLVNLASGSLPRSMTTSTRFDIWRESSVSDRSRDCMLDGKTLMKASMSSTTCWLGYVVVLLVCSLMIVV